MNQNYRKYDNMQGSPYSVDNTEWQGVVAEEIAGQWEAELLTTDRIEALDYARADIHALMVKRKLIDIRDVLYDLAFAEVQRDPNKHAPLDVTEN